MLCVYTVCMCVCGMMRYIQFENKNVLFLFCLFCPATTFHTVADFE